MITARSVVKYREVRRQSCLGNANDSVPRAPEIISCEIRDVGVSSKIRQKNIKERHSRLRPTGERNFHMSSIFVYINIDIYTHL